jgi:putative ABC transport system permease protein
MNAFENELLKYNSITAITAASTMPGAGFIRGLVIPQGFTEQDNLFVPWVSVDYDFLPSFQIPLLAGRDFSKDTGTDHLQAFIINASAVRMFGWNTPEEAVGKEIIRGDAENGKKGQIVGVIKDFHFNTLDFPMGPLIMDVNAARFTEFAIRLQADHTPETLAYIKQQWDTTFPERVFEYSFLDENIDAYYNAQENLGKTIGYFASLAILISCMGLFGLTSLLTLQRTKEIGIRKVLGAGVSSIVRLLSKELLSLIGIALLIGTPIAWYIMHRWLQNFAYRIEVGWELLLTAGMAALLLAWFTVGYQTIKAALTNPVESLRNE